MSNEARAGIMPKQNPMIGEKVEKNIYKLDSDIEEMSTEEKRELFGYLTEYEDEKWKPCRLKNGFVAKGYEVSNYGKVRNSKGRILAVNGSYGIKGKKSYPGFNIRLNTKEWEEYTGQKRRPAKGDSATTFGFSMTCHQAVMNSHKPFDENLLPELEEHWHLFSDKLKMLIRDAIIIDHIDDNPWNNHVDNLKYCTFSDNQWTTKTHEK